MTEEKAYHWLKPSRVIIGVSGAGVRPTPALMEKVTIVFIRNDGWSLAAPARLERAAYNIWKDCWSSFVRWPETQTRPISEYTPP